MSECHVNSTIVSAIYNMTLGIQNDKLKNRIMPQLLDVVKRMAYKSILIFTIL